VGNPCQAQPSNKERHRPGKAGRAIKEERRSLGGTGARSRHHALDSKGAQPEDGKKNKRSSKWNGAQPYHPCLVQLYEENALRHAAGVPDAGARLSLQLGHKMAEALNYSHHLYDCKTQVHCMKPRALADACYQQSCSHIYYTDSDVFLIDEGIDVIQDVRDNFPDAVVAMGLDYHKTMINPAWHDGTKRMYRTDSNAGTSVIACNQPLSKRVLLSWSHLCHRYSPAKSDQEAITLMETLPQYVHANIFVRQVLFLGQYSIIAKHFPGDKGKSLLAHLAFPLPGQFNYTGISNELEGSGMFKFMRDYWQSRGLFPETEAWRVSDQLTTGWTGLDKLAKMKTCPRDHLMNELQGTGKATK